MTDLTAFGAGAVEPPPRVERKVIKQSPHTGKIAGFVAQDVRRGYVVYTALRGHRHFYREGEGWAVSDSILHELTERHRATRILVHTGIEDGDVYEFLTRQFTDEGEAVPTEYLVEESDPQTWVAADDAIDIFLGHAGSLFVRPFHEACDRIGWRGYDERLRERVQQRRTG